MTSVKNTNKIRIIDKCPWCGGHLTWSEYSGQVGVSFPAYCSRSKYVTKYTISQFNDDCHFECKGTRVSQGNISFTCSEEYYWRHRWNEVQYNLPFKEK